MKPVVGLIVGSVVGVGLITFTVAAVDTAVGVFAPGPAAEIAASHADHGSPALAHVDEIIMARQLLMDSNETAMGAIENQPDLPLAALQAAAYQVYIDLSAFPYLFPAETMPVASPNGSPPATSATMAVWDDFETFRGKAVAAASVAFTASQAGDADAFRAAAKEMRAACDGCHKVYLHVAEPTR